MELTGMTRIGFLFLVCMILMYGWVGAVEQNTDRPGMNLKSFDLESADPELCAQECDNLAACKAWTYVKPGIQGDNARCWLKHGVPDPVANECCVSGIKTISQVHIEKEMVVLDKKKMIPKVQGPITTEMDTDRPGMNLKDFDLTSDDYKLCQQECQNEPECKAYTYVKPGIQRANARCWLKNGVPDAAKSECCISGVKSETPGGVPEIINIMPKEPDGKPYAFSGDKITITGKNFSSDPNKNKIGIRSYEQNPSIPPTDERDLVAEIVPIASTPDNLEAIAPGNVGKDRYWVWVYVEGAGNSQPVEMWLAPKPVPKPIPKITKVDPTYPGGRTAIYGINFKPGTRVEWDVLGFSTFIAEYISPTLIKSGTPYGIHAGVYELKVEADGVPSDWYKATLTEPKPLNIFWDKVDDNGIPFNPKWGWQLVRKQTDPDYYPDIPKIAPKTSTNSCFGATTGVERDYSQATDQPISKCYGLFGCGPHVNWDPVTYEGFLKWSSKSDVGKDDEYNFYLFAPEGAGSTARTDGNVGGTQLEFDSDETIDHFHTPWWDSFHKAVDKGGDYALAHYMVDGRYTIATGLWGLDCGHENCQSEVHPVWSIAIHVKDNPDDDVWAMFARNWGNEGYCGSGYLGKKKWYVYYAMEGNKYVFKFRLPWRPGASSVHWTDNFLKRNDISMDISPIPNEAVLVSFFMPDPDQEDRINGEIHFTWEYPQNAPAKPYSLTVASVASNLVKDATGTKTSEEDLLFDKILQKIDPEKQETFKQDIMQLQAKEAAVVDVAIPVRTKNQFVMMKEKPVRSFSKKFMQKEQQTNRLKLMEDAFRKVGLEPPVSRDSGMTTVDKSMIAVEKFHKETLTTEMDTDRPGINYKNFDLDSPDYNVCKQECEKAPQCKAYTYVKPGVQGNKARCWLKSGIPDAVPSDCCISGKK